MTTDDFRVQFLLFFFKISPGVNFFLRLKREVEITPEKTHWAGCLGTSLLARNLGRSRKPFFVYVCVASGPSSNATFDPSEVQSRLARYLNTSSKCSYSVRLERLSCTFDPACPHKTGSGVCSCHISGARKHV